MQADSVRSLRVAAGKYKGRVLEAPKGKMMRPISGTIKEALFSILGDSVRDCNFLDLFAGTGAVGIEAISRGANKVAFVEKEREFYGIIHSNIQNLGIFAQSDIFHDDVFKFRSDLGFDIVFAGYPYSDNYGSDIIRICASDIVLKPGGILILQRHFREKIVIEGNFIATKNKKYGITVLDFFQYQA